MLNTTVGTKVISPGVGVWHREAEYVHQAYYQWIPPLLIIQGLIFYLPRGIWKLFEHETMGKLMGKNGKSIICHPNGSKLMLLFWIKIIDGPLMTEKWKEKRNLLILYLKNINKKYHRCYVIKYFICECLSIVSIIFNMFLFKWVINDFWVEYQPAIGALIHGDLLKFRQQSTVLFPLQAKCNYTSFGNSGSMVNHDALCYMPLNVVNEKIFVFLYFWYIFILFYATLNLIYFLTLLAFNSLRLIDVGRMCERTVTRRECKKISGNGDFGFWFTLHIFHKNLSPVFFQDLAKELIERTDEQKSFRKPSSSINLDDEEEKY